jgi:O-antigen/teichoic acid export membrane protein
LRPPQPPASPAALPDSTPDAKDARPGHARATNLVVRDAGVIMAGDLFDRALGFAFLLTATKIYSLEAYGAYLLALAVFHVIRTIVSFGLGRSIVKDTAAGAAIENLGQVKGAIVLGLAISLSLALLLGAGLIFGAGQLVSVFFPRQPEVVSPLRVFGLLTPLFALNFVLLQAFYGLDRIRLMVVANNVVEPLTRLTALVGLYAAGVSGYVALPYAYLIALVVSSLFALTLFRKHVWARLAGVPTILRVRETFAFTVPVTLNDLASRSFRSFNTYLFALYRTSTEISLISIAFKLTGVVFFFSSSLTAAFRPRIARLLAQGNVVELEAETRAYCRWILTFALLPYGLLILFPEVMLRALGPQFVPAAGALRILCVGLLVVQAAGPLMALLIMSGRSKPPLYFVLAGASLYTGLALYAIPRFGMEGAATAAVTTILLVVPILSVYVQRSLGLRIYGRTMWKPLAGGVVAFGAGLAVAYVVPAVRVLDAAAIATTTAIVYLGMLVALGVEPAERDLLVQLLKRLKKIKRKLRA